MATYKLGLLVTLSILLPVIVYSKHHKRLLKVSLTGICGTVFDKDINLRDSYLSNRSAAEERHFRSEQADRLARELVLVRLNIVYDLTFAEEFNNNRIEIERYVRNVVYSTQLVYEQAELFGRVKINLVVVSLVPTNFFSNAQASDYIHELSSIPEVRNQDADLHILFTFNQLYGNRGNIITAIEGMAQVKTFCRDNFQRGVIVKANSLSAYPVFAHELAHSFGCDHDGLTNNCNENLYIMSPSVGVGKKRWSQCTVNCILENMINASDCIFSKERMKRAKPLSAQFDLTPDVNNPNRVPLPGEAYTLDQQCNIAFGGSAISSLTKYGSNREHTTCEWLYCVVGYSDNLLVEYGIGPAPTGSTCSISTGQGRCQDTSCKG